MRIGRKGHIFGSSLLTLQFQDWVEIETNEIPLPSLKPLTDSQHILSPNCQIEILLKILLSNRKLIAGGHPQGGFASGVEPA